MKKAKWYTEKVVSIVLVQMHFIQRKQFSETNVTLHAFQEISDLKIFPEWFRGPLKTMWRATCGLRACGWTTLDYMALLVLKYDRRKVCFKM